MQSLKVDADTPDLYVREGSSTLRAMNADGTHKWKYPYLAILLAADNKGGVLATTGDGTGNAIASIDKSGNRVWFVNPPGWGLASGIAVHPNGTVFAIAQPPDANGKNKGVLTGYNGDTGQSTGTVEFPLNTIIYSGYTENYHNSHTNSNYSICSPGSNTNKTRDFNNVFANGVFNPVVIGPDGSVFTSGTHTATTYTANCTPQFDSETGEPLPWSFPSDAPYNYTAYLDLVKIDANNSPSVQTIDSVGGGGAGWNTNPSAYGVGAIIPDGSAGAIIAANRPNQSTIVYRTGGGNLSSPLNGVNGMLLGEGNATLFLSANPGLAALSLSTGSTLWQRTDAATLKAALQDGSLLVEAGDLRFIDPAGSAALFSGGTAITQSSYAVSDFWLGKSANGNTSVIADGIPNNGAIAAPGVARDSGTIHAQDTVNFPYEWWFAHSAWAYINGNFQGQSSLPALVERTPAHGETTQENYNAIELVTQQTPEQIFNNELRSFTGLGGGSPTNSVAQIISTLPIIGIGDEITFRQER